MQNNVVAINTEFMNNALERNYAMPNTAITQLGQVIDLELDSVPGWAESLDLAVSLNLNVASTALPAWSPFAPWNFFSEVQISLGGGPFQRVSPYFYFLRELITHDGWQPSQSVVSSGASALTYNLPAIANGDLFPKFTIRVPLQAVYGSALGLIPMGSASTKLKVRLTVANTLTGVDQFLNPLYGGTGVNATIGVAQPSSISPSINYLTTPATKAQLANPVIGNVLNIQQRSTAFVGAGALTPVRFPDPFRYLRLYHIIIDGTGAPTTAAITNFEMDLTPGYPQYNYATPSALQSYYYKTRRLYGSDLPTGVLLFDLQGGSDPMNPNGTQIVDGSMFQTLQTQVQVSAGTNVASPAKIITFAEALSPVGF